MASFLEEVGTIAIIILIIGSFAELVLLGVAWYYADEVDCNLLWCTFTMPSETTTYCSINGVESNCSDDISTKTITTSQCYMNGAEINCSGIAKDINWSEVIP